jgi:hypothetical protein
MSAIGYTLAKTQIGRFSPEGGAAGVRRQPVAISTPKKRIIQAKRMVLRFSLCLGRTTDDIVSASKKHALHAVVYVNVVEIWI